MSHRQRAGDRMHEEIGSLYRRLKENVSVKKLKEISSDIIDAYKMKNFSLLRRYASGIGLEVAALKKNRLFSRLIQIYHPDKFKLITREIDGSFKNNDIEALKKYERIFTLDMAGGKMAVEYSEDYDIDTEDFDRFGMAIVGDEYFRYGEDDEPERSTDIDFYEALRRELGGEMKYSISPFDLNSLDGELDLSDYGISHLDGIERLINITSLNLSGNRICDLGPLASLSNLESLFVSENLIRDIEALRTLHGLKELDVTFNNIENADLLLDLENLNYVNLAGNRIGNESVADTLREKNIIVVY